MELTAPLPTNPQREEFFDQLRKRIVLFLIRHRGLRADQAEDVAQNTILTVLANPPELKGGDADLLPWCIGIARHLASAKMRENLKTMQEPRLGWWMSTPASRNDSLDEGAAMDRIDELEAALRDIEGQCRELLRRRLNREASIKIAAILKISVATLYVREHRCRQQLRKTILAKRGTARRNL